MKIFHKFKRNRLWQLKLIQYKFINLNLNTVKTLKRKQKKKELKKYLYNHCHFKDLFLHHLHDFDLKNILEPRKMKLKGKKRRN